VSLGTHETRVRRAAGKKPSRLFRFPAPGVGISVLLALSAGDAAQQMRAAFPKAKKLHEAAKTVGSTTEGLIASAGFDIIAVPSRALPNHYRLIHPAGVAGFTDGNLARLAAVFVNTTGHLQ
jgi:hypothetical protein